MNRNATFARGVPSRMSQAVAIIAPGADADAVDRRDHRLRAGADRLHEVAGHAREAQQAAHVHLGQRADDVAHVAAGAEVALLAR